MKTMKENVTIFDHPLILHKLSILRDKNTSSNKDKTSSSSKDDKKDDTTVKGKIPYTGSSYVVIFAIAIILIAGIIAKVKYNDLKSVTPGQACVFYLEDECLGGGIIKEVRKKQEKLWYL